MVPWSARALQLAALPKASACTTDAPLAWISGRSRCARNTSRTVNVSPSAQSWRRSEDWTTRAWKRPSSDTCWSGVVAKSLMRAVMRRNCGEHNARIGSQRGPATSKHMEAAGGAVVGGAAFQRTRRLAPERTLRGPGPSVLRIRSSQNSNKLRTSAGARQNGSWTPSDAITVAVPVAAVHAGAATKASAPAAKQGVEQCRRRGCTRQSPQGALVGGPSCAVSPRRRRHRAGCN